jgi:hypothetical protein
LPIDGVWRNPAIRRCNRKIAYSSWHKAEERAEKASLRTGDLIIAYQCYDCGKFHIGHADQSQKIVREVSVSSVNSNCPRCTAPISDERRYRAAESGNTTVFCSGKCRDKWAKKRRQAKKLAGANEVRMDDFEQREKYLLELMATEKVNPWQWYLIAFSDFSGLQGAVLIEGPGTTHVLYRWRQLGIDPGNTAVSVTPLNETLLTPAILAEKEKLMSRSECDRIFLGLYATHGSNLFKK